MADKTAVTRATGVAVETLDDGEHTALWFNTGTPPMGVVLAPQELGILAGKVIEAASKNAAKTAVVKQGVSALTSYPIQIASVGVARGRSETEALLSMQVGQLSLVFAVELPMLLGMCSNLRSTTVEGKPKTVN